MTLRRQRIVVRPARVRYRTRAAVSTVKPIFLLVAVGAGLVWGGAALGDAWNRAAWLRVREVRIAPASLRDGVPPEGFHRAVGLEPGTSLLKFSARDTAARLKSVFPELAEVRVRRTLRGGVKVIFERRRAAAKVWKAGQWLGMDTDGELFPLGAFAPEDAPPDKLLPEEKARPLPILSDVPSGAAARPILAFVELLRRSPQPWARGFYKIKLTSSGDLILFLKDGPTILWGDATEDEARLSAKSGRLERVLQDPRLSAGVESVRFVDDRRLAVKPKASKEPS